MMPSLSGVNFSFNPFKDGIAKGILIAFNVIKGYNSSFLKLIRRVESEGGVLRPATADETGYFWTRSFSPFSNFSEWDLGKTYERKYTCKIVNGVFPYFETKYYKSIQDSNINNPPETSPLWWEEIEGFETITSYPSSYANVNCFLTMGVAGIITFNDYVIADIWKVNNPGGALEDLTLVTHKADEGNFYFDLLPGYYKYRFRTKAQGSNSDSYISLSVVRGDNNIEFGQKIRVFKSDFSDLAPYGTTPLTAALAYEGRLTSDTFLGGVPE